MRWTTESTLTTLKAETLRPNRARNGSLTTKEESLESGTGIRTTWSTGNMMGGRFVLSVPKMGGRARSRPQNTEFYFQESLTWSDVTSGPASFRLNGSGGIHDVTGMSAFSFRGVERLLLAGYCNTPIVLAIARTTNPTLHFQIGNFVNIPFIEVVGGKPQP